MIVLGIGEQDLGLIEWIAKNVSKSQACEKQLKNRDQIEFLIILYKTYMQR